YAHADAQDTISRFKSGQERWIISVGMISEGTDIPRLRVCCHLTTIKTELHFRQVLGRILRSNGQPNHAAYLYMPADPMLVEFASSVLEDVPEAATIVLDSLPTVVPIEATQHPAPANLGSDKHREISITMLRSGQKPATDIYTVAKLAGIYDRSVSFFG